MAPAFVSQHFQISYSQTPGQIQLKFYMQTAAKVTHPSINIFKHFFSETKEQIQVIYHMGLDARKPILGVCEQQKRRLACAYAQTDQRLCYSLFWKVTSYLNLLQAKFRVSS